MRVALIGASLLLLAGCGREPVDGDGGVDVNQIERLATAKQEEPDLTASARLQPLSREDLDREGLSGAGCDFSSDGRLLLVSVGGDALARIGGRLRHFVQSAPAVESGGFFEDRQVSISVGRTRVEGRTVDELRRWPARATVTNRRTEQQVKITGEWRCGA